MTQNNKLNYYKISLERLQKLNLGDKAGYYNWRYAWKVLYRQLSEDIRQFKKDRCSEDKVTQSNASWRLAGFSEVANSYMLTLTEAKELSWKNKQK